MTQITAEETSELFTAHPELAVNVHNVRTLGVWLAERNLFPTPENFALAVSKLKEQNLLEAAPFTPEEEEMMSSEELRKYVLLPGFKKAAEAEVARGNSAVTGFHTTWYLPQC